MEGIHPSLCTHHISLIEGCSPVRQPQRRMKQTFKGLIKEEFQKFLNSIFIYPISQRP